MLGLDKKTIQALKTHESLRKMFGFPSGGVSYKVLDYNNSKNGTPVVAINSSGSGQHFNMSNVAGLTALFGRDNANGYKLALSTDDGATFGTPLVVTGIAVGAPISVAVLSTSLVAVAYCDSTNYYPTVKTFTVSGTTPTLDQTLTINSSGASTRTKNVHIRRATSGRLWCMYENSSSYPAAIGVNASAGSLTKDVSAAVLRSNVLARTGTKVQTGLALSGSTTGFAVMKTTAIGALEYIPITDSGTALTGGSTVAFGSSDANQYPFINCTARTMMAGAYAEDSGFTYVHVAQISGATVNSFWPAGGSTFSTGRGLALPVRYAGYDGDSRPDTAAMGATDANDIDWYCIPTYYEAQDSRRYSFQFLGIDAVTEVRNVRMRMHRMTAAWFGGSAGDSLAYHMGLTATSSTRVLSAVWDDGTGADLYVTALNF